jgi:hypothetical protein
MYTPMQPEYVSKPFLVIGFPKTSVLLNPSLGAVFLSVESAMFKI